MLKKNERSNNRELDKPILSKSSVKDKISQILFHKSNSLSENEIIPIANSLSAKWNNGNLNTDKFIQILIQNDAETLTQNKRR